MGGLSVRKLVKPTKVFCSRPSHQSGVDQLLFPQAKPQVWARAAGVLREANPAVGQELGRLDPANRIGDQMAEFVALLVANGGAEVLDLDQSLAHEDDLGDFGDAGHPGIADQLRIECQQTIRFFGITG